jgi:hypothetical protein
MNLLVFKHEGLTPALALRAVPGQVTKEKKETFVYSPALQRTQYGARVASFVFN